MNGLVSQNSHAKTRFQCFKKEAHMAANQLDKGGKVMLMDVLNITINESC